MFGKKNKLNILIVTQYFWPENFRINDLALYLSKKGHDITVLTGEPNYPEGKIYSEYKLNKKNFFKFNGIKILRVSILPRGKSKFSLILNYVSFTLASIFYVIFKLGNRKFDLVFTSQYSPVFVAIPSIFIKKIKNIKHFIWVQDLWPETLLDIKALKKGKIYYWIKKIVKFIFNNSDVIFVQSKQFAKVIKKNYKIKNIEYLPNWPEDIFLNYPKNKKNYKFNDNFNIVFTGNIGQAQDFKNIIKAAYLLKEYKNIFWHIYGNGRDYQKSLQSIKEKKLNKNFIFHGKRKLDEMPEVLFKSSVLIITMIKSNFLNKTIPGKFQTYLTAKKPIVGMIGGVTNEIIKKNKLGFASKPGDYKSFSKNLLKIYKNKNNIIKKFKINSFNYYFQNFNKEKNLSNLENIMLKKVNE